VVGEEGSTKGARKGERRSGRGQIGERPSEGIAVARVKDGEGERWTAFGWSGTARRGGRDLATGLGRWKESSPPERCFGEAGRLQGRKGG
jgi:hypothetical protein